MKINKIPLYDVQISKEAIREVTATLKSGWLSTGPKVARFEKEISKKFGFKYAAGVSSASQGLELMLSAHQIGPGDEIITSPYTFVSTIEAIHSVGAKPVFVDIDPYSLNINSDLIRAKINDRTMAIITVDVGGFPCDYQKLKKLAQDEGLLLLGDAAHSISSKYKAKPIFKYCDASVLSFHATKNLICGEGGMVLSDNKKIMERLQLLARHGISAGALQRKRIKITGNMMSLLPVTKQPCRNFMPPSGWDSLNPMTKKNKNGKSWPDVILKIFQPLINIWNCRLPINMPSMAGTCLSPN